ncbi:MAG: MBL fold metallo-hydrolase [Phormidesmis sp.]
MNHLALPADHPPQSAVQHDSLSVTFWGVRGSVPTPIAANQRYGGNTVCVEVSVGGRRIIFDGGTGLVELGHHLQQQQTRHDAHIFFTHTQWDRIQGFPFFQPAFMPGNRFSIYGGTALNGASIKHCLTDQMLLPHFSMPLQHMLADLSFHTLTGKSSFEIDDLLVETIQINPITEALGYRLSWQDYTLVYATDTPTEHVDPAFLEFVAQADILIYDGTYCDLTYLRSSSESTMALQPWQLGIDIVQKANVKQLVMLHHSPLQNDDALDQLQCEVSDRFANVQIAYEGMVVTL